MGAEKCLVCIHNNHEGKKKWEGGDEFLLKCWVVRFEMSLWIEIVNVWTNEMHFGVISGSNNFFLCLQKLLRSLRSADQTCFPCHHYLINISSFPSTIPSPITPIPQQISNLWWKTINRPNNNKPHNNNNFFSHHLIINNKLTFTKAFANLCPPSCQLVILPRMQPLLQSRDIHLVN